MNKLYKKQAEVVLEYYAGSGQEFVPDESIQFNLHRAPRHVQVAIDSLLRNFTSFDQILEIARRLKDAR